MDTETTAAEVQQVEAPAGVEAGQGEDSYQGLYDLSAAPEHLRPLLEAELKKVTANVDGRFREHADFRKQWEPFESVEGLKDVPAEELAQLLEFREVANDPEAFEAWWFQSGKALGYFEDDGEGPEAGTDLEMGEPGGTNPEIAQLMETVQSMAQKLEEFEQRGQSEKVKAEIRADQERQLAELQEEHGEFDHELVLRLSRDYLSEPDYVKRGFEDYLRITGQAQSTLVEDKLDAPGPANAGGRPDTGTTPPGTFKEAAAAALQRLGG